MVTPADILESGKTNLGNDGTYLAARGRDSMASRPVTSWEGFPRDDGGSAIWAKIREKVGKAIQEHEGSLTFGEDSVEAESLQVKPTRRSIDDL
jgi:hypothetical protein